MARLVSFDEGRVGELRGDKVVELEVPSMRHYFERDQVPRPTGVEFAPVLGQVSRPCSSREM